MSTLRISESMIEMIRACVLDTSFIDYDFDGLLALVNAQPFMCEADIILTDEEMYELASEIPEIEDFIDHRGY